MRNMTLACFVLCTALCGNLAADDFGDAPVGYGLMECWTNPSQICLGNSVSDDTQNPVAPAWAGDNDDGLVGTPLWNPVSWDNQLTVHVGGQYGGWLMMWVDANDDGAWGASEFYLYSDIWVEAGADYTFTGIRLSRPQGFSLNGANKVAVRIVIQDNWGGAMLTQPSGFFFYGEIEDWLIDVTPAGFAVTTPMVRDLVESSSSSASIKCAGGTPPYTWTLTSGALPAGMTLTQAGDDFVLSGTPSAGAGAGSPLYAFDVESNDSLGAIAQRSYEVRVLPPPYAAPFLDTFSTDLGWVLGNTWTRGAATAYAGKDVNSSYGEPPTEPGVDATPASNDNMILADSLGGPFTYGQVMYQPLWATSPIIDCSALTTVELRFKRWVSTRHGGYIHGHDRLRVQVTNNDGATWQDVWKSSEQHNAGTPVLVDSAWTLMIYDVSTLAAGQASIRIRFGVGPARDAGATALAGQWVADDSAGWCIDDLQIAAPPSDALQVSNFVLSSAMTFQHPVNAVTYPVGMKGFTHAWQATLANGGADNVDVSSIEVGITFPEQPGNTDLYLAFFHAKHQSWYDAGPWSLNAPVTVAAGTSGVTISGTLDCNGLEIYLAMLVMRCELFVRGTVAATGEPVESRAIMECVFHAKPPGLHVHEAPTGSLPQAEIANGEPATGLRNYGSVATGGVSAWVNFICKTNSSTAFTVDAPTLTGADASQFELYLSGTWPAQPAQGQNNVYFSVRFKPTSLGVKSAWIEFAHTAVNAISPFTFEVKGTGVGSAPIVGVMEVDPYTGYAVANGAAAGGERDFGQVDITAAPPAPRAVYVTNTGTQTLTLGTPSLAAGASGAFSLDLSQFGASVPAGSYTTIIISFAPTALGAHSAWIEFSHNDSGTSNPFTFEVAGEGVVNAPVIEVRLGGLFGPVIASGNPAGGMTQFGALNVGVASGPLQVHLRNLGQVDLTIATPTATGTHGADFQVNTSGMATVLSFGQTTMFEILFAPLAKGPKSAAIAIGHNDTQAPQPFTIPVAGAGIDPNGVVFTSAPLLPNGKIGNVYSHTLAAAGGTAPYTFVVSGGSLPAGLTLAAGGTLDGTPTGNFGIFTFKARVIDALFGEDERQFEIIIQPPPGHVEKSGSGGDSGCAATTSGAAWCCLWIMLAAWLRRRASHAV